MRQASTREIEGLDAALAAKLAAASNLSDVASAATARTNLGLGTAATRNVPATGNAAAGEVVLGSDTRLSGGGGGSAASGYPGLISGEFYQGTWNSTTTSTATMVAGLLFLHSFLVPNTATLNLLRANVTVVGAAGTLRMGLYASDSNNKPGALVLDAGTVTGAATGSRDIVISQAVSAGLYWIAALQEVAGGTWTAYAAGMTMNVLGSNNYYRATGVAAGALPASASAAVPGSGGTAGLRVQTRVA